MFALDDDACLVLHCGYFTPRHRDAVLIVHEARWASRPVRTGTENPVSVLGFESRTAKSLASRYTDRALSATITDLQFFCCFSDSVSWPPVTVLRAYAHWIHHTH
jgi:hypothetical protein